MGSQFPEGDVPGGFSGNPPRRVSYNDPMEARVAKLEADVGDIRDVLRRLEPAITRLVADVGDIKKDLAELKGKVSQMPTLWSMGGTMLAINAGIVGVAGLIVVLIKNL